MKKLMLCVVAFAGLWYAGPSDAMIQSEVRCSNWTITVGGTISHGTYCWIEYHLVPGTPPSWDPPMIPDLPGGDPPAPNPSMCQAVLDNWPDGCSEEESPFPQPDGCDLAFDNAGPVGFTSACNSHDMCYTTLGMSKATCDGNFGSDLRSRCTSYYQFALRYADDGDIIVLLQEQDACWNTAEFYEDVVSAVPAWAFFDDAQEVAECEKAHDDRDQYCE